MNKINMISELDSLIRDAKNMQHTVGMTLIGNPSLPNEFYNELTTLENKIMALSTEIMTTYIKLLSMN